ncbi:MAG: folate family ECF transporter S component [Oscillospiraceae bacterium]
MQFFKSAAAELHRTASLAGAAMMAALNLVLNQITIPVSNMLEIGFTFLAAGACGYLYGPWLAGLAGVAADIMGYFLRPNGAFFPGFTLNEFVLGFIYGAFFYKRKITLPRTVAACCTAVLCVNLCLTPLWLYILYGKSFLALLGVRLIKNAIKLPIDICLLHFTLKTIEKHRKPERLGT